jgi:hypothetical protein
MKKLKLDNGWFVTKMEGKSAVLHITPLPNSIFRKYQSVDIPDEIFNDIELGEVSIKELFNKYKLHEFIFQWENRQPEISKRPANSSTIFYGNGFIATNEKNGYFLEYEISSHGGGHRKIPITKDIYDDARNGDKSTSDLFKKFNLYHLDIPENDIK